MVENLGTLKTSETTHKQSENKIKYCLVNNNCSFPLEHKGSDLSFIFGLSYSWIRVVWICGDWLKWIEETIQEQEFIESTLALLALQKEKVLFFHILSNKYCLHLHLCQFIPTKKINYTTQLSTQSQLQVVSQNCYCISTSPEDVAKQLPDWVHLPLDQTQLHWDLMVEEVCETYWRQTVEQTEHSFTIAWNENHWKNPTVNDFLSNPGKTSKIS